MNDKNVQQGGEQQAGLPAPTLGDSPKFVEMVPGSQNEGSPGARRLPALRFTGVVWPPIPEEFRTPEEQAEIDRRGEGHRPFRPIPRHHP